MRDVRLNDYLNDLEGYPLIDPQLEDLQWGLLNRYRHDFVYFRGMAKQFRDEALQALMLHREQRDKMVSSGYKLGALDLSIPNFPLEVRNNEKMELDNA